MSSSASCTTFTSAGVLNGGLVGATEGKRRGDTSRSFSLVARWGAKEKGARSLAAKAGAAMRAPDLGQALRCTLEPPAR